MLIYVRKWLAVIILHLVFNPLFPFLEAIATQTP